MAPALDRILGEVRRIAAAGAAHAVAVFDLDSTLLSTAQRNLAILHEFGARAEATAELRQSIARLSVDDMGWNVMDDLRRYGFAHEPVLKELRRFWFERFFTSPYLRHDEPLPGAADYVREVHAAGALIVYLTGRDEPGMGVGTRDSLRAHGFPMDTPRVVMRLKPEFREDDLVFKKRVTVEIGALGTVVAAFENEPANANFFAEAFPAAHILLLETVHSPNPPPLSPRVVRLKDFRR